MFILNDAISSWQGYYIFTSKTLCSEFWSLISVWWAKYHRYPMVAEIIVFFVMEGYLPITCSLYVPQIVTICPEFNFAKQISQSELWVWWLVLPVRRGKSSGFHENFASIRLPTWKRSEWYDNLPNTTLALRYLGFIVIYLSLFSFSLF